MTHLAQLYAGLSIAEESLEVRGVKLNGHFAIGLHQLKVLVFLEGSRSVAIHDGACVVKVLIER